MKLWPRAKVFLMVAPLCLATGRIGLSRSLFEKGDNSVFSLVSTGRMALALNMSLTADEAAVTDAGAGVQDTTALAPTEDSAPPLSELLRGAGWPPRHEYDQSFAAVLRRADASAPCAAPFLARARLSPHGFGAHLNQFANEVLLAIYAGKPVALCAPPGVRDQWATYFEDPGFGYCDACDWKAGPRQYREMGMDISQDPEKMAEIKRIVYQRLFALRRGPQAAVNSGVQRLGLPTVYVGVHIRRGDKFQEVPPVPLERYVTATRQMCFRTGTRTVFVASDDDEAKGQLQEALGSGFTVIEQERLPAEAYTLRGEAARSMPPPFGEEEAERSLLVDVAGLVNAAGFIGTASSNVGRLVYFQRPPGSPAVSLDGGTGGFLLMT